MTRLRPSGASARQARLRPSGASARQARLRPFGASARQVRLRPFGASARQVRLRPFGASARQARLRPFGASARQALRLASLAQGRLRLGFVAACTAAFIITGGASTVLACPVCFGAEETAMVDGTKLGILVMLAVTFAVQGGFVGFFLYLRRRAKRMAELELDAEWSKLQRASRTS